MAEKPTAVVEVASDSAPYQREAGETAERRVGTPVGRSASLASRAEDAAKPHHDTIEHREAEAVERRHPLAIAAPSTLTESAKRVAVIIVGMHRSGTSAMTRVVSLLGADLPRNLMPAIAENNDAGFWESLDVCRLNDDILASAGSQWDDWRRFDPGWAKTPKKQAFQARALEILRRDFAHSALFVLKDPRICRLLPFWLSVLRGFNTVPACILPIRNPLEVAASLKKRDGFSPMKSYALWLRHILDAEYASRGLQRAFVRYERLLQDWPRTVSYMSPALGVSWPRRPAVAQAEITHFLSGQHRHHASDDDHIQSHPEMGMWVKEVFAAVTMLEESPQSVDALQRLDRVRTEFDRACELLGPLARVEELARRTQEAASANRIHELERSLSQRTQQMSELRDAAAREAAHTSIMQRTLAEHQARILQLEQEANLREDRINELQLKLCSADSRQFALKNLNRTLLCRLDMTQTCASWQLSAPLRALEARAPRAVRGIAGVAKIIWWAMSFRLRQRLRLRRRAAELLRSELFDRTWYIETNPQIVLDGKNPIYHWLLVGAQEGRDPNPSFDRSWYLARNTDAKSTGEGRDPHPCFDTAWYIKQHLAVIKSSLSPLAHYLHSRRRKGHINSPVQTGVRPSDRDF